MCYFRDVSLALLDPDGSIIMGLDELYMYERHHYGNHVYID